MNAARNRFSVVVDASAPVPPYPADTRAKGWRFDLDYERIEQSDTWVLAPADMRPWLLMLWLTAWKQTPCGSLPTQDELIAARIGMDLRQFRAHRDLLMRGWDIHNDGRYYHHVITEQVLSLIAGREKTAARQNRNRSKSTTCDPMSRVTDEESRVTAPSVTAPSPSPSPSPKGKPTVSPVERKRSSAPEVPVGVDAGVWNDWLKVRKEKKAAVTDTAVDGIRAEAIKAGMTLQQALETCCRQGWAGFKAAWVAETQGARQQPRQQSTAERDAEVRRLLGIDAAQLDVIEGGDYAR